jgi:hypothetical protein
MVIKPLRTIIGGTSKGRFLSLLITLLLYLVLVPFFAKLFTLRLLADIFMTAILLVGIYATGRKKRHLVVAMLLGLPLFLSNWSTYFVKSALLVSIGTVAGSLFFAYMIFILLSFLFRENEVTAEVIYAAIVGYLFLGLLWTFVYRLMFSIDPSSFQVTLNQTRNSYRIFIYFSFVTLTTLGYGDITPLSDQACALTVLEAVVGQLYLAVMIARLVGIHISQSVNKKNEYDGKKR